MLGSISARVLPSVGLPINPSFRRIANTVLRSALSCLFSQKTIRGETNFLTLTIFRLY